MALGAGTIALLIFGVVLLVISVWWFAVGLKYNLSVGQFSYPRGANLDTTPGSPYGSVNLKCDGGKQICVWRATGICTGESTNNFELGADPFSGGSIDFPNEYGDFDPTTTLDLTQDMMNVANGKETATYNFNGVNNNKRPITCGNGTRPQLIATYSCIPPGSGCTSYKKGTLPQQKPCSTFRSNSYYNSIVNTPSKDWSNFTRNGVITLIGEATGFNGQSVGNDILMNYLKLDCDAMLQNNQSVINILQSTQPGNWTNNMKTDAISILSKAVGIPVNILQSQTNTILYGMLFGK